MTSPSKAAAKRIMASLRERGELCYILGPRRPENGPWATVETQEAIERHIAEIIKEEMEG